MHEDINMRNDISKKMYEYESTMINCNTSNKGRYTQKNDGHAECSTPNACPSSLLADRRLSTRRVDYVTHSIA